MDLVSAPPARRRRGQELEDALLDAAWDELTEVGYSGFTIDGVAVRAGTSRPVVYRRWPTKQDLVRAAVTRAGTRDRVPIPDTGSLRGDVIALMKSANATRLAFAAVVSLQLGRYFQETGTGPADLRELMLRGNISSIELIVQRAVERGEVDPATVTPRITTLPFDLFRNEVLMTMKPVPLRTIEEIVDTLFLPLILRKPDGHRD